MSTNKFLRGICSLPVIFFSLYFIPFLGVCLVILREFIYKDRNKYSTSISIIVFGILIFIPKVVDSILQLINSETINISYLNEFVKSATYVDILKYGEFLLILGVILLIISSIFQTIIDKIKILLHSTINNEMKIQKEIDKENDLKIKLKQEKAKHTNYVKCSNCGSDNIVSEKIGTCKYCRQPIENKGYKA